MRTLVGCLLATLLLAGCVTREGGTPGIDDVPDQVPQSVDLAVPIELRPVLEPGTAEQPELVLPTEDGEQLALAGPMLTIRSLDDARVEIEQNSGTWVLSLDLDDSDGKAFGDWTADHTGERLAMVADQEVLMAPQIQSAIPGGEIQITANYTRDEAEALLEKITGR